LGIQLNLHGDFFNSITIINNVNSISSNQKNNAKKTNGGIMELIFCCDENPFHL
jgi:hypothetical protein